LSTYTRKNTGRKCYGAEYHTGGGVVCTIEAMKLENYTMSPVKGSGKAVLASPNTIVKTGNKLAAYRILKGG
jgi:acetyl/propionyl-CoA carboxylase alpha subunit